MLYDKKILAFIPARGGSKGIKHKNIYNVLGKPLVSYIINAAKKSKYVDEIIVSTDDMEIADIAKNCGAKIPFMRPAEFAQDTSKTLDAVLHGVRWLKEHGELYDILVLLQPTQPLTSAQDIDNAIEIFLSREDASQKGLVALSPVHDHPILIRAVNDDGTISRLLNVGSTVRRQDMPVYYRVNGCIYINLFASIDEHTSFNDNLLAYVMPKERSIDVDDLSDIAQIEYYLKNTGGGIIEE